MMNREIAEQQTYDRHDHWARASTLFSLGHVWMFLSLCNLQQACNGRALTRKLQKDKHLLEITIERNMAVHSQGRAREWLNPSAISYSGDTGGVIWTDVDQSMCSDPVLLMRASLTLQSVNGFTYSYQTWSNSWQQKSMCLSHVKDWHENGLGDCREIIGFRSWPMRKMLSPALSGHLQILFILLQSPSPFT